MKFRRLLASILSALMIISCFSFVASAEDTQVVNDPVKIFTPSNFSHFYTASGSNMKVTKKAVDESTGYIYNRYSFNENSKPVESAETYADTYQNLGMTVNNGLVYFSMLMRTNQAGTPNVRTLNGSYSGYFYAESPVTGDNSWQRVVIKLENEGLTDFKQMHIRPVGSLTTADVADDFYYDIAGFAFFEDEYSALNFDFTPYIIQYEDENVVYLDQTNGSDSNDGRHSKRAVATFAAANTVIKNDTTNTINTISIIGTYFAARSDTWAHHEPIGAAGEEVTITGYTADSLLDYSRQTKSDGTTLYANDCGLLLAGPITFDNITINGNGNDGHIRTVGNKLVFNSNVRFSDSLSYQPRIGIEAPQGATAYAKFDNIKSKGIFAGALQGGSAYGNVTIEFNNGYASIIGLGRTYRGSRTFRGTANVIVNGGQVGSLSLDCGSDSANAYAGLRYFTVNGGWVGGITSTSTKKYGASGANTLAADTQTGVTVFEINKKGAVEGRIATKDGSDDSTRVYIFNNDSYVEGKVLDTDAYTINAIGGDLKATVTVEDDYTATLDGFTYTLDSESYDQVTIGETTVPLSTFENKFIPATYFAKNVNTVTFSRKIVTANYTVESYIMDINGAYSEVPVTETKNAEVETEVTPEAKTGFTIDAEKSDASGVVTADGNLVLKVYYARNQYKLYTKLDGAADAVEVDTYYYEAPVTAPEEPSENNGLTFNGWDITVPTTMPANDVTLTGTWKSTSNRVYISDSGKDVNTGLTEDTPVLTLAKAQELLAEEGKDTLVVVGEYTYRTYIALNKEGTNSAIVNTTTGFTLGLASKELITVTGVDADAVFNINDPNGTDEILSLGGNVKFENIKFNGSPNDGRIETKGYTFTIGEGFTRVWNNGTGASSNVSFAIGASVDSTINITDGSVERLYPGYFNTGTYKNTATVNISGAETRVEFFALGHSWHDYTTYNGNIIANISNGAKIGTLKIQSNGTGTNAKYAGLRYFTLDNATVDTIYTTGKGKQSWNGGSVEASAANRTGISVFEFNNGAKATNPIAAGGGADNSTRIIIFNDGTTGKVTDTGAIVVNVTGGALKADVTTTAAASSQEATLNGYTFTTDKAYININGINYEVAETIAAPSEGGEEVVLAEDTATTVSGTISKDLLNVGTNTVIFSDKPLYTITWADGEETVKTELVAEGTVPTAPTLTKTGNVLNGWTPEIVAVDGDTTYTAVWYDEPDYIDAYRAEGYEVVYVSADGDGTKSGTAPNDAYANLVDAINAKTAADKKTVFSLVDDYTFSQNATFNVRGVTVITSAGGKISSGAYNLTLGIINSGHIIFDNITYEYGNGERCINLKGNDFTATETARFTDVGTTDNYILNINAAEDGQAAVDGNTLTTYSPDAIQLRAGGYGGNNTTGDINYVVGGNANNVLLTLAGKGRSDTDPISKVSGNVTVTVKDNAVVKSITAAQGCSVITGTLTIDVKDNAQIIKIALEGSNDTKAVEGLTRVNVTSGKVDEITTNTSFGGEIVVVADTDNATLTSAAGDYVIKYNGDKGTVVPNADNTKITVTPADGVKYIRITNGETEKEYDVSGNGVQLMSDLAFDLAAGTTTVEFLEDGTEGKTVTWVSDGETVKSELVEINTVPTAPTLTKTGYTLSWDKELVAVTEDTTYTAVWTAKEYDVVFNAGDGKFADGENTETVKAIFDSAITAPTEEPTRTGYTFNGWTPEVGTLTTEGATFTAVWTINKYTITFNAGEGTFTNGSKEITVDVDYNTTPTAPEVPTLSGYEFKGWTPELAPATEAATYTAVFENLTVTEEPTYITYGSYDELTETYTVELALSGTKAHIGSFGFKFPTEYMTLTGVKANTDAGIDLFAEATDEIPAASPIFAKDVANGIYANTWSAELLTEVGYVDTTAAEVVLVTFTFTMTAAQREAFEANFVANNKKFDEYVIVSPDAKYYENGSYLVAEYVEGLDTTKTAVAYDSHVEEVTETKVIYTTEGTYEAGKYTVKVFVKGEKINLGAFGVVFNSDYMTYDPTAENAFTLAQGIANYLGTTLYNAADGIAFVYDGSANDTGYIDATTDAVHIATITATMTKVQKDAYEAAGAGKFALLDISSVDTEGMYYDNGNYLIAPYRDALNTTERIPTTYESHKHTAITSTVADVNVTVNLTKKADGGEAASNLAVLKIGNETIAIESAGSTEKALKHTLESLTIGEEYTVTVERNGYLAATAIFTVVEGTNELVFNLIAGDIKDDKNATFGNGTVELGDFVRIIRAFEDGVSNEFAQSVDLDDSGFVNVTDLGIIKENFNKTSSDTPITFNGTSIGGSVNEGN